MIPRWLDPVVSDVSLGRKMRFVAGPRQCGKTTLARTILAAHGSGALLYNWDIPSIRKRYREDSLFYRADSAGLADAWACFDEIHKARRWKDILKGVFDADADRLTVLVTGSARLDMFRRAGDSLAGRYYLFHLPPLLLGEIVGAPAPPEVEDARTWIDGRLQARAGKGHLAGGVNPREAFEALWSFGPFPEPFLKASQRLLRLWRRGYVDAVIQGDLRDVSQIRSLDTVESLIDLLPRRVGNPFSVNAVREDLEVAHATVKGMMAHLERLMVTFSISPYARRIGRPVKRERKVYLFEWSVVEDPGARFENLVALELVGWTRLWTETTGVEYSLRFVRDREGKETDFLVLREGSPWCLIECKLRHGEVESHHLRFAHALGDLPVVQLVREHDVLRARGRDVVSVSASRFLA